MLRGVDSCLLVRGVDSCLVHAESSMQHNDIKRIGFICMLTCYSFGMPTQAWSMAPEPLYQY